MTNPQEPSPVDDDKITPVDQVTELELKLATAQTKNDELTAQLDSTQRRLNALVDQQIQRPVGFMVAASAQHGGRRFLASLPVNQNDPTFQSLLLSIHRALQKECGYVGSIRSFDAEVTAYYDPSEIPSRLRHLFSSST